MTGPQPSAIERLRALTTEVAAVVRRHDPDWTGSNSSDPGVVLVELLGWVGDRLGVYQDLIAGESALGTATRDPTARGRTDPYKNFKFRVKWDGAYIAGITRVSALRRTARVAEYRDGADPNVVRLIPGPMEYEPLTLERGVTADTAFEAWANQVREAAAGGGSETTASYRKNIRIEVLGETGQPVIAYDVYRCWPSVYRPLPDLEAGRSSRLVELLTLVHEGWERDPSVVWPESG
jgi:phage tail-like protein